MISVYLILDFSPDCFLFVRKMRFFVDGLSMAEKENRRWKSPEIFRMEGESIEMKKNKEKKGIA